MLNRCDFRLLLVLRFFGKRIIRYRLPILNQLHPLACLGTTAFLRDGLARAPSRGTTLGAFPQAANVDIQT